MTLSSSSPEPLFFKAISDEYLIDCIGNILTEIAAENAKILDKKMSIFDSKTTPTISIKDYLKRLMKFSYCCQETLIVALIYLDRLFNQNPGVFPCDSNLHRSFNFYFLFFFFENLNFYKNFKVCPNFAYSCYKIHGG